MWFNIAAFNFLASVVLVRVSFCSRVYPAQQMINQFLEHTQQPMTQLINKINTTEQRETKIKESKEMHTRQKQLHYENMQRNRKTENRKIICNKNLSPTFLSQKKVLRHLKLSRTSGKDNVFAELIKIIRI